MKTRIKVITIMVDGVYVSSYIAQYKEVFLSSWRDVQLSDVYGFSWHGSLSSVEQEIGHKAKSLGFAKAMIDKLLELCELAAQRQKIRDTKVVTYLTYP